MGWSEFQEDTVLVTPAEAETRRFGLRVQNVVCGQKISQSEPLIDFKHLVADADLTILKFPSNLIATSQSLAMFRGHAIVADSMVYWASPLLQNTSTEKFEMFAEVEISQSDDKTVEGVIRSAFDAYQSHWHFNPRTSHLNMADAYCEWASFGMRSSGHNIFCLKIKNQEAGMAMTKISHGVLEVLLAGIHQDFQGRGYYSFLLSHIQMHAIANDCHKVVISTQSQNVKVQKAWSKFGLVPAMTIHCVHLENR